MDRGYGRKRETHPKDKAGFLSLASFAYIFKFVRKGREKEIDENDLTNVMHSLRSKEAGDKLEKCWERCKIKDKKPSVMKAVLYCYGFRLFFLWIAQLISTVIQTYTVPWALGRFVSYFERGQTSITRNEALFYALVMALVDVVNSLWKQHYGLWKTELSISIQASVSSLLYRKALSLSQAKLSTITTGSIVTGFTKDVQTVNMAILFGIDNIVEIVQIGLISYLLYQKVGIASVGGIAVILICVLSQGLFAKFTYSRRGACNEKSDQRLRQTQEVLSSIRLIKMYGWESFFEKRLLFLRKIELKNLYMIFILKSMARIVGTVCEKVAHISTLLIYLWLGRRLNADIIYYTTKLFQKISRAMMFLPLGIQSLSEFMIALKRINTILQAEESSVGSRGSMQLLKPEITFVKAEVDVERLNILRSLNLKLKTGLNILIGPSGCGKSSLLKTILEEYNTSNGKMIVQGTISYASQNPWLFPSSLKQNILFGEPMNEYKYTKILAACGLTHDINNFATGDEVVLTDCGANLSRGQQARINLARSLYRDSDIYLLDDCLASLDVNIQSHVFTNAIKSYLSNKLCLLVTHSTEFVSQADNVIIMDEGTIKYSGKPCDIPTELHQVKEYYHNTINESNEISQNQDGKKIEDETAQETTKLLSDNKESRMQNIYEEDKKGGSVDFEVYKGYVMYGGGLIMLVGICSFQLMHDAASGLGEKFLSKWLNAQQAISSNTSKWSSNYKMVNLSGAVTDKTHTTTSYITTEMYSSSLLPTTTMDNGTAIYDITTNFLNYTTHGYKSGGMDYFNYYVGVTIFATIFTFISAFVNTHYAVKISRNMHKSMISSLLHGWMSFFDTHMIGNVLTRFSRDLFIVDEFIPFLWHMLRMIFVLGITFALIASVNPLFAGMSVIMGLMFYFISNYLLSTTRNLQRINSATLSPMIGHLNTTLDGLMIIRAHGTQQILRDEYDKHQDLFTTALHLREISTKVMGFYCHLIAALFTSFVTIRLLFIEGALAGDAGLVLSQAHAIGHQLEWGLMLWMLMENNMTCVERILEYTKIPEENKSGSSLENWPHQGEIKFQNVSLTYRTNNETVLKNLNFTIHPQEKIGIVGRTGAGKSSIIVTLFKMYDFAGDITIDNVNIKTLSLDCLRTNLAIIPQDPIIFTGTVRSNIDPFNIITDEEVWKILDIVNLKCHFKSLDEDITEKNLSIGQKQLVSVARALIKKRKIVILDEATANMDEGMDTFIQKKIGELFKFCTVITVAHRLNTVLNSDRIIVMNDGEIVEFDTPQNLLSNPGGVFHSMVYHNDGSLSPSIDESMIKKLI